MPPTYLLLLALSHGGAVLMTHWALLALKRRQAGLFAGMLAALVAFGSLAYQAYATVPALWWPGALLHVEEPLAGLIAIWVMAALGHIAGAYLAKRKAAHPSAQLESQSRLSKSR